MCLDFFYAGQLLSTMFFHHCGSVQFILDPSLNSTANKTSASANDCSVTPKKLKPRVCINAPTISLLACYATPLVSAGWRWRTEEDKDEDGVVEGGRVKRRGWKTESGELINIHLGHVAVRQYYRLLGAQNHPLWCRGHQWFWWVQGKSRSHVPGRSARCL